MLLTPIVRRRLRRFVPAAVLLCGAVGFALYGLSENVTYFYTPGDLAALPQKPDARIRLGGLVPVGSLHRDGVRIDFEVTDLTGARLRVHYVGLPPDLFREGQGAVVEGRLQPDGSFLADTLLAKHDENYMPPELKGRIPAGGSK